MNSEAPPTVTEGTVIHDGQTVGPNCEEKGTPGWWYCTVHETGFPSNIAAWGHWIEPGDHIAAWICTAHGPEVP